MFNRKTLFIVGAGAGADVNMPVGRGLALDIAKRTKVRLVHFDRLEKGTADQDLALSFFEKGNGKAQVACDVEKWVVTLAGNDSSVMPEKTFDFD